MDPIAQPSSVPAGSRHECPGARLGTDDRRGAAGASNRRAAVGYTATGITGYAVYRVRTALAAALIVLGAAGCGRAPPAPAAAPDAHASRPADVAWFEGEIGQAFVVAQRQRKPVFVYFGAVWCPPCQELKATIFRRQDFLDRLSLFVPVYLDGDAPGAQRWADEFRVTGYPTVLILRGDRSELERVSGGMDLSRYAEVLDLGTTALHPVAELLASLDQGRAVLSRDDCRILAYNAWDLDEAWIFSDDHPGWLEHMSDALSRAAARCPLDAGIERARLVITAASAAASAEGGALQAGQAASARLASAVAVLRALLVDEALASSVGDALEGLPLGFFVAAARGDAAHAGEFLAHWKRIMDALGADPRYSQASRLYALRSQIIASKGLERSGAVPPALADGAKRRIDAALAQEHEPLARTSVVNAALNVLDELDDTERSYAILAGEIRTSKTPYYYMGDLGQLEEQRGNQEAAVGWLARAYRESQGQATRFQWGVSYVRGLLRMRPDDETAIQRAALEVLGELEGEGRIHGRSRRRLDYLAAQLHAWNRDGQHAATIGVLRARMDGICRKLPAGDSAHAACNGFLAKV